MVQWDGNKKEDFDSKFKFMYCIVFDVIVVVVASNVFKEIGKNPSFTLMAQLAIRQRDLTTILLTSVT